MPLKISIPGDSLVTPGFFTANQMEEFSEWWETFAYRRSVVRS